jgi:hypothetical protein
MKFPRNRAAGLLVAAAMLCFLAFLAPASRAGEGGPYWSDAVSGLAIDGYDPVAYFVHGEPRKGDSAHEAEWGGTVWLFENAGNRAAFLDAPMVYAPRFGGYSAPGLAKGIVVAGNPLIWTVHDKRLYLFYSPVHKLMFEKAAAEVTAQAEQHWPKLSRTIVP